MKEEELEEQKKQLIEQLGVLMERKHQIAPLAARILSTVVLSGQQGVTFDELVTGLKASKSSISTHLDNLQSTRKIKFFTRPGDRKRYFVINPDLTIEMIDETVANWESEKKVHREILQYKKQRNDLNKDKNLQPLCLDFQENLIVFLEEATTAIEKLKQGLLKSRRP